MRTTTTTALAVGATALAIPVAPARGDIPHTVKAPGPPLGGHLTVQGQMRSFGRRQVRRRLATRAVRLAARAARARGERFSRTAYRRGLRGDSAADLRARIRASRATIDAPAASPALQAIAACESGGNPATDTGNGFYGKYQFTLATWASVGGRGNPAAAGEAEQDRRAAILYAREGSSPWPVCGR